MWRANQDSVSSRCPKSDHRWQIVQNLDSYKVVTTITITSVYITLMLLGRQQLSVFFFRENCMCFSRLVKSFLCT